MELQMKRLKSELHTAQLELNKTAGMHKEAQNQIQMLSKEKGKCSYSSSHTKMTTLYAKPSGF